MRIFNKKEKNTFEIKYYELLEKYTQILEQKNNENEEFNHYKKLCEEQRIEIKKLKRGEIKNGKKF